MFYLSLYKWDIIQNYIIKSVVILIRSMKFTFNHIGLFLLVLFIYNCKKEVKPKKESIKNSKIENRELSGLNTTSKEVTIIGKSDEINALKYLNLLNFSNFGFSSYQNPENRELFTDSLHLTLLEINQPQLMDLIAFSDRKDTVPYFTRIMITPGDSIHMDVKNGKIEFLGKNKAHYNFFLEMNDPLRQNWATYKQDPYEYQSELTNSYKQKDAFLQDYIVRNPGVSADFKNLVKSEIKFEYLYNLVLPRNVNSKTIEGNYQNSTNSMAYEYALNNPSFSEDLFDYKRYFGNISIEDFKRPELLNNDYFKRSLVLYIRHYFANHEYLDYTRKNFLDEKTFIQENLDGKLETFAIGRLINDYYKHGFGSGEQDINIIRNLIKEYEKHFSEPSYLERMNTIIAELDTYNFELPQRAMDEKLLTIDGDTITFGRILQKAGKSIKALDFWASWCGPCILDIKISRNFREKISNQKNMKFIYLSLDTKKENWINKVENLKNDINNDQQYLILDSKKSKIVNFLVNKDKRDRIWFPIPRYSILNVNNRIISSNAPRPSDSLNFRKVIEQIKH